MEFPIVIWNDHYRFDHYGFDPRCFNPPLVQLFLYLGALQSRFKPFSLRLNGILLYGCATGLTVGSTKLSTDIVFVFNFPTPSNTSEYYCLNLLALDVTIAMVIPTLNTPISEAIAFPEVTPLYL